MKYVKISPMVLGLLFSWTSSLVNAQADPSATAPLTREQVITERDQFLKTHFFDTVNEVWLSKDALLKMYGQKSRAVVQSEEPDTAVAKK